MAESYLVEWRGSMAVSRMKVRFRELAEDEMNTCGLWLTFRETEKASVYRCLLQ
jgi:hypothetical protein